MSWLKRNPITITTSILFLFFLVFFTTVQPLVVFDGDDWGNLAMERIPIPKITGFNPIKILPETLYPVIGYIAAYVLYPIIGNYLFSITLISALTVSLFAALLAAAFMAFCRRTLALSAFESALCGILFISFHFLFFRSSRESNIYLFGSVNLTCYMHYVVPNLLNAALVLFFATKQNLQEWFSQALPIQKGALILVLYFAIFSNLFNNSILGIFFLSLLFLSFLRKSGTPLTRLKAVCAENRFIGWTAVVWFFSLACEATGGRARGIGKHPLYIKESLEYLGITFSHTGKYMLIVALLIILGALYAYRKSRKAGQNLWSPAEMHLFRAFGLSLFGILAYTVLLCSKAGFGYITRPDVVYGSCFYILCLLFLCLSATLRHLKWTEIGLPLFTVLVVLLSSYSKYPLEYSTMGRVSPADAIQVSQNILEQVLQADKENKTEMILVVPKGDNNDNWPHPNYIGHCLRDTLSSHGLIQRKMEIEIKVEPEMNKQYYHK